ARLRRGHAIQQYETTGVRADGTPVALALTLSPIRNAAGTIVGGSVIARDITAARQVAEEREALLRREHELRHEAEAASRAKDEFLSIISHELRTPLTSIVGYAQLLRRRVANADPETVQMAATIDRSAHLQMRLVNDLLDLSRVMSGKLQIEREPVALDRLVQAAVEAARPEAEAKAITLTVQLDPAVGPVLGDASRLQQVVANLISNALKFTPGPGSVTVTLDRVGGQARLAVRDSGIGIPPAFLPHVFERFRQADTSPTRSYGGLGLGLAIAQMLVELHGGRIEVSSEGAGCGSTFTVTLPLIDASAAASEPDQMERSAVRLSPSRRLAGRRLLVVEDDADTRDLLRLTLEIEGAQVTMAASSAEALALLEDTAAELVVCDIGMPAEDGYTFLRKLRARYDGVGERLPVIALTAYAAPEDRRRALAAGFQRHLAKPIDASALVAAIETLLPREDAVVQAERSPA
ncbi:MAG TPA: ATP-binding protein, partial [Dehalococcoidia bacterium]